MLYKNGVNIFQNGTSNSYYAELAHVVRLNVGDTIEVYGQNTGGTVINGNNLTTGFTGALLNGGGSGSGGSTSAAGSNGQIQFNTSGNFDAGAGLTWDSANTSLNVSGKVSATVVQLSDNPSQTCNASNYGTIKMVNGRQYTCRP